MAPETFCPDRHLSSAHAPSLRLKIGAVLGQDIASNDTVMGCALQERYLF
jgi:hypothetical protein